MLTTLHIVYFDVVLSIFGLAVLPFHVACCHIFYIWNAKVIYGFGGFYKKVVILQGLIANKFNLRPREVQRQFNFRSPLPEHLSRVQIVKASNEDSHWASKPHNTVLAGRPVVNYSSVPKGQFLKAEYEQHFCQLGV
jgi:hypothetical protein